MSTHSRSSPRRSTERIDEPPLRAVLLIEPAEDVNCPVAREAPNATAVTRTTTHRQSRPTCRSEVTVVEDGDAESRYVSSSVTTGCVCETMERFECIADVAGVRGGALEVSLLVSDRSVLSDVVEALEETGATVRLERITRRTAGPDPGTVELDVTAITAKQREAVELAVELGYYDDPRGTDLAELADRLGVSRSAVSQRLNAAELTLVRELVDD